MTLTQCSALQSIRKMCHLASIVSQDGDIRFCDRTITTVLYTLLVPS